MDLPLTLALSPEGRGDAWRQALHLTGEGQVNGLAPPLTLSPKGKGDWLRCLNGAVHDFT